MHGQIPPCIFRTAGSEGFPKGAAHELGKCPSHLLFPGQQADFSTYYLEHVS
jgi:hypothetical protein